MAYQADVTDFEAVQAMVKAIVDEFGRIDILVNNAGLVLPKSFPETTPEQWKAQIDIGLYAVIHTCHAVTPYMTEQGDGRIINLTGDSARVGEKYLSITASSRGGVLALTKSLAKELGKSGIRINAVSLGLLETSHSDKAWLDANRSKIERQYALRRIGFPQDVAPMVVFLASDATSWVTGQIISGEWGVSNGRVVKIFIAKFRL